MMISYLIQYIIVACISFISIVEATRFVVVQLQDYIVHLCMSVIHCSCIQVALFLRNRLYFTLSYAYANLIVCVTNICFRIVFTTYDHFLNIYLPDISSYDVIISFIYYANTIYGMYSIIVLGIRVSINRYLLPIYIDIGSVNCLTACQTTLGAIYNAS